MPEAQDIKYLEHPLIWPKTVEYRLYQKLIADTAFKGNTLVILPTALGKTIISAIVSANILYNYPDSKILIMAPTRPLVVQHQQSYLQILKLGESDTAILTGKTLPRYRGIVWDSAAKIVFSTPQVVRNDLLSQRLSLENYSLVVFDECHRAAKRYAYTDIAESYISNANYPIILGMTASPGSDLSRVLEVCRNLYIERIEYRTEDDSDVKPYIHPIKLKWVRTDLLQEYQIVRTQIKKMLFERTNGLNARGLLKKRPEYATRRDLVEVGNTLRVMLEESVEEERGRIFSAIIIQSLALILFHMLVLLETQGFFTLRSFLEKVELESKDKRSYAVLLKDPEYVKLHALVERNYVEHPKVKLLFQSVSDQLKKNPSSRMLVFTQYRDTASHLVDRLNKLSGVKADRFVGQASTLRDKGLTQKEQVRRIQMLESGQLNILVATSIAEEGLDIPTVNHVIFYEPIPSEIRYIQRRGRTGRKAPGDVTILATNDTLDMIYQYVSRRRTERMKKIAETVSSKLHPILRSRNRPAPRPMTKKELIELESVAVKIEVEPELIKTEEESMKEFSKTVERATRSIYMELLERGVSGGKVEHLVFEVGPEELSTPTIKAAISKLMKDGLVMEKSQGTYVVTSAFKSEGQSYDIIVEKIVPGSATVLVNNKWRARLTPENYNGPRNLIKKNSRFRASAELYKLNEILCIRVKEVIQMIT